MRKTWNLKTILHFSHSIFLFQCSYISSLWHLNKGNRYPSVQTSAPCPFLLFGSRELHPYQWIYVPKHTWTLRMLFLSNLTMPPHLRLSFHHFICTVTFMLFSSVHKRTIVRQSCLFWSVFKGFSGFSVVLSVLYSKWQKIKCMVASSILQINICSCRWQLQSIKSHKLHIINSIPWVPKA